MPSQSGLKSLSLRVTNTAPRVDSASAITWENVHNVRKAFFFLVKKMLMIRSNKNLDHITITNRRLRKVLYLAKGGMASSKQLKILCVTHSR